MSDRVKSNSMQDVFHAAGNSANIDFGKYAPKDKMNPLGAREMSDAIQAIADSNYNTGKYVVEYSDIEKAMARANIKAAENKIAIRDSFDNYSKQFSFKDESAILTKAVVLYRPARTGSGEASSENVRPFVAAPKFIIRVTNENFLGGDILRKALKNYFASITENADGSLTWVASADAVTRAIIISGGLFKSNTRYTFIFNGNRSNASTQSINLRWTYTDGNVTNMSVTNPTDVKSRALVSGSNKTVASIIRTSTSGSTTIYPDKCALLEGVKTTDDFIECKGTYIEIENTENLMGARIDFTEGKIYPAKRYQSYNGETLVGPWLSSMDEYSEGATPTTGADVIDYGDFETTPVEIPIVLPIKIPSPNCAIIFDSCISGDLEFEVSMDAYLQDIIDAQDTKIATLESDIASLDARVTALENPSETTNSVNPSNSPLNLDPSITRPDFEISEAAIEPNEPTESTDNI